MNLSLCFLSLLLKHCLFLREFLFLYRDHLICDPNEIVFLVLISPFAFFFFAWGSGGAPCFDVFYFKIFYLNIFVLSLSVFLLWFLIQCFFCCWCFVVLIKSLRRWSYWKRFLVSSKVFFLIKYWIWRLSAVVYRSISICAPSVAAVASFSVEYFCGRCVIRLSVTCLVYISQASTKMASMALFKGANSWY